jgi:transcriptional regulator with XRE-family HTH domain
MNTDQLEAELGNQIRKLRLAAHLDQSQLALNAGLSLSAIKRLEGGQGSAVSTVIKALTALGQESWICTLSPESKISPMAILLATRKEPRQRVYRPRKKATIDHSG